MNCSLRALGFSLLLLCLPGCLAVARVSDFPGSAAAIDFRKYSAEDSVARAAVLRGNDPIGKSWTSATSNEYYLEKSFGGDELKLLYLIKYALEANGYSLIKADVANKHLLAERAQRANEWKSLTGVHYQMAPQTGRVQVYINTKITQDITGGFRQNRALEVGVTLEKMLAAHR